MSNQAQNIEFWKDLLQYTDCLESVVEKWQEFFTEDFLPDLFHRDEVLAWVADLTHTIVALKHMHVYDHKNMLEICSTASGFPDQYHIRYLHHPIITNGEQPNLATAKKMFLDSIFGTVSVNHWALKKVAESRFRELREKNSLLLPFKIRSLKLTQTEDGTHTYRCCFERYCNRHVPSLYLMLFESGEELTMEQVQELSFVLEEGTSMLPLLGNLAEEIDRAMMFIRPMWVGRIVLGPVFVSGITKDEHELQRTVDALAAPEELLAASRIIYEYVQTKENVPVHRLLDAKGRRHSVIQDFAIRQIDDECRIRKVSFVEKYLFAPHSVIQQLDDEFRRTLGHKLIGDE